MVKAPDNSRVFESLVKVVEALRGPEGCPWDKEQTHSTLTRYAIEEVHEYVDAVENGDDQEMCEELGDVLLQVVLNAEVAKQRGAFGIDDVVEAICKKMVSRHPHVFGDVDASNDPTVTVTAPNLGSVFGADAKTSDEVLANWQVLKAKEKAAKSTSANKSSASVDGGADLKMSVKKDFGLARGLPALMAAQKIGEKTAHLNFDWSSADAVVLKVREELDEVLEEMKPSRPQAANISSFGMTNTKTSADGSNKAANIRLKSELGDLLFSVVQLCRHLNVDSEQALREGNRKFEKRFFTAVQLCEQSGHDWMKLEASDRENFWRQAKNLD